MLVPVGPELPVPAPVPGTYPNVSVPLTVGTIFLVQVTGTVIGTERADTGTGDSGYGQQQSVK